MAKLAARTRARAALGLTELLDSKLFKALCEPIRVEILKTLTAEGRCDVSTIAAHFPQDSSVVSRHLAILHDAGIVRREKEGRHVFFELDGPAMVERMEKILDQFRTIVALCCPAADE
jgi:DNA-binding transcriptional ArsR family regulator